MKKLSVTIIIPAYNEEANIKSLLTMLLKQKRTSFDLKEIVVVSDASTDNTVSEVKEVKNKLITLLSLPKRVGKASVLNTLFQRIKTDVVVVFDADIAIDDTLTVTKMIAPIRTSQVDLTSARVIERKPISLVQHMLLASMKMKKEIFEKYNSGNNIFTCHGRAYALSRNLYSTLRFKKTTLAEDAYSFLFVVKHDFSYKFVKHAHVSYQLPINLSDHEKQSIRFFYSYEQLSQVFAEEFVKKHTSLPKTITFVVFVKYLVKNPFAIASYIIIFSLMRLRAIYEQEVKATWSIALSSKILTTKI